MGPVAASEAALAPSPASATLPLTAPDPRGDARGFRSLRTRVGPRSPGRHRPLHRHAPDGADTTAVVDKARKRDGVKADHSFGKAVHGFSAKLDAQQKHDLPADPNVLAVVPDGVIQIDGQTIPTGVVADRWPRQDSTGRRDRRHRTSASMPTWPSSTPASRPRPGPQRRRRLQLLDLRPRAWRDKNDHGTHVAGTVGALDNGFGVVGVAPGARVWAVKILNDDGYGLISWYVCGLDWILAQRDPNDPSRPLFEAVNMSVTKPGSDDHNCG